MVKANGTVFVVGEELSRDTEAQLRYLWSALQSRGGLSRFSEVRLRDGKRLQENLRASASAVFVGRVPIDLINFARASDAAAIYWGIEVEKSDWQSFAQLRQIIAAADVLVVATSEETIAPAELAGTPVVAVGRGVPAAGKETPVKEALTVVDADAHDSLAYAELLRLIDQCDVLIAGQSWMAVLESLARGKCVAIRRSHPFAGKILDGVNGIVLSDEAPKNLEREVANKVRGRLPQISLAAKRTWEAEFRIDQVCDRLLVLLGKADRREFQRKRADKSYDARFARYDSIGSGERATIRRQLRALRQQPLISIVLPVFNPALKFLHAAVDAQEFDRVIASTIFGAPVIRAAGSADIPHLWWIHEGRVAEHYLSKDSALREALAMADLIVTPDTRSSQVYQPFIDRPVRVLSYGIPDPSAKVQPALRSETKPIEFLLLGTIEHRKGQQLLLEALRKLSDEVLQKTRFRIVGRAHDPAITEEIKRAGQKSSYLSYEDGVSPDAALALIRDTDVMLCASWDETGPLILMEALALGKPILSSNVGAVAEYLSPEAEGLFFSPGDADALARGIVRMALEPELRDRLSRNARRSYEKYFSFENFAENFVNLLMEAISSRKERRATDKARAA